MGRHNQLLVAAIVIAAMNSCSSETPTDSASPTSPDSSGSPPPGFVSENSPATLSVGEGTLTLPSGAPSDVLIATLRDDRGLRCIEVRRPAGSVSGVCYDDEFDQLSYGTASADDGVVFVVGATELATASRLVAVLADGQRVEIPISSVDGWPERPFVAMFDEAPTRLEAVDSSGQVVATATN